MSITRNIWDNQLTLRSYKWTHYFDMYDKWFSHWRDKNPVFVEVGVNHGGSMQMWQKYFTGKPEIYGIDIDTYVLNLPLPGVELVIGDQSDPKFWDDFLARVPHIDVFLDDGGHTMAQQITTFKKVWPHITQGGVYVCEDLHTSYWPEFQKDSPGFTMQDLAKTLTDYINIQHWKDTNKADGNLRELSRDLAEISFCDSMVMFRKDKIIAKDVEKLPW